MGVYSFSIIEKTISDQFLKKEKKRKEKNLFPTVCLLPFVKKSVVYIGVVYFLTLYYVLQMYLFTLIPCHTALMTNFIISKKKKNEVAQLVFLESTKSFNSSSKRIATLCRH